MHGWSLFLLFECFQADLACRLRQPLSALGHGAQRPPMAGLCCEMNESGASSFTPSATSFAIWTCGCSSATLETDKHPYCQTAGPLPRRAWHLPDLIMTRSPHPPQNAYTLNRALGAEAGVPQEEATSYLSCLGPSASSQGIHTERPSHGSGAKDEPEEKQHNVMVHFPSLPLLQLQTKPASSPLGPLLVLLLPPWPPPFPAHSQQDN